MRFIERPLGRSALLAVAEGDLMQAVRAAAEASVLRGVGHETGRG